LKSGVPILDSLHITGELVGNRTYMTIIYEAEQNVRKGGKMSEVFNLYEEIPPMFASMVSIGEKTGKLDAILKHISKFYKDESENTIQTISTILEPALVLLLGVAVAIMVSSILLPIYNLVGSA
jgi:type IV pilus assembly protein PilC